MAWYYIGYQETPYNGFALKRHGLNDSRYAYGHANVAIKVSVKLQMDKLILDAYRESGGNIWTNVDIRELKLLTIAESQYAWVELVG